MVNINLTHHIKQAWRDSPPLTFTCLLMLATFVASLAAMLVDERSITGVNAWLKPAKFGISTAIFTGTLVWMLRYVHVWRGFGRFLAWVLSLIILIEVVIINLQAARGTTSHFNISTPLDGTLFIIMGMSIGILVFASTGFTLLLFRQNFSDRSFGWALRLGLLITVLGSSIAGFMSRPTPWNRVGSHTVGAADGGPGIPGIGWSSQHGDLRVPHFLGLHGAQFVPLFWLLARRRQRRNLTGKVLIASASYAALIAILTWQALRGQSIAQPDSLTLLVFLCWALVSYLGITEIRGHDSIQSQAVAQS